MGEILTGHGTAPCFSNPHTNFGARRSRRLGVVCHKLGSAIFLVTLACLDLSSKKRGLYRLFTYHRKAHTISNKLVSKVFAQKKGGRSYDRSHMYSNFGQISVASGVVLLQNSACQSLLLYIYDILNKRRHKYYYDETRMMW